MLVAAAAPAADAPRRARPSLPPPAFISIAVQMPPKVTLAPSVPGRAMTEYGTLGAPQQAAPRHEGHGGRPLPGSAAGTAHRPFFSPMMSGMGGSSGLGYGANPDAMLAMMRPMMSMYGGKKQHTDVDPNVIPAVRAPAAAQLATPGRRLPRGDSRGGRHPCPTRLLARHRCKRCSSCRFRKGTRPRTWCTAAAHAAHPSARAPRSSPYSAPARVSPPARVSQDKAVTFGAVIAGMGGVHGLRGHTLKRLAGCAQVLPH